MPPGDPSGYPRGAAVRSRRRSAVAARGAYVGECAPPRHQILTPWKQFGNIVVRQLQPCAGCIKFVSIPRGGKKSGCATRLG
jgi:hypothetical protein